MDAINSGELVVVDPREVRERELKATYVAQKNKKCKARRRPHSDPPPTSSVSTTSTARDGMASASVPATITLPEPRARLRRSHSFDAATICGRSFVEDVLRHENATLKAENERLRKASPMAGGEILDGDHSRQLEYFQRRLAEVLQMRTSGKFIQATVDEYHGAAVQLSEKDFVKTYQCLMKVYCDEADEEALAHLGIEETQDEVTMGFIEAACNKMGEQMSLPRPMRIQKHHQELQMREELEAERVKKAEKELQLLQAHVALRAAGQRVFESLSPMWSALAEGRGEVAEAKRFRWRKELQLLLMPAAEMKKLSTYEWQNMSLGGLQASERFGLLAKLTAPDVPGQADKFVSSLRHKLGTVAPSDAEVADMCCLPAWFVHDASISVGARVLTLLGDVGVVRFKGPTAFREGVWVGVELQKPNGKNDGVVQGVRYFRCEPKHGLFTNVEKLVLVAEPKPEPEPIAEPLRERKVGFLSRNGSWVEAKVLAREILSRAASEECEPHHEPHCERAAAGRANGLVSRTEVATTLSVVLEVGGSGQVLLTLSWW